jgi:hypothetical protein
VRWALLTSLCVLSHTPNLTDNSTRCGLGWRTQCPVMDSEQRSWSLSTTPPSSHPPHPHLCTLPSCPQIILSQSTHDAGAGTSGKLAEAESLNHRLGGVGPHFPTLSGKPQSGWSIATRGIFWAQVKHCADHAGQQTAGLHWMGADLVLAG